MTLDPKNAALYALIAVSLILVGAIITAVDVPASERAAVLVGTIGVLLLIAFGIRIRRTGD